MEEIRAIREIRGKNLRAAARYNVKTILISLLFLAAAVPGYAAEADTTSHKYDFTIIGGDGQVLGRGTLFLPFKLGADGKGTARWQFTPTDATTTNKYWLKAKAQLGQGEGKADAECRHSWFTLNFNPGWADNNVTVAWPIDKTNRGTLHFDDFVGGHPCACFSTNKAPVNR